MTGLVLRTIRGPVVLGLDPAFRHFGWALVEIQEAHECVIEIGTWHTKPAPKKRQVLKSSDDRRCGMELATQLWWKIREYDVRALCTEVGIVSKGVRSSRTMGRANGLVDALAAAHGPTGLPVLEVSSGDLKLAAAGSKTASKSQVEASLRARYGSARELDADEHAWDALGAVVACLESSEVRMLRQLARRVG